MLAKRPITRLVFTTLIFVSLFFSNLGTTPVYAAGMAVNTDVDEITTNGLCSLREAITNANDDVATYPDCASGAEADTITFAGDYTITLDGSQLPAVTSDLIINGNGAENTIIQASANPAAATYRVFEVSNTGNLTLNNLTAQNGDCTLQRCAATGSTGGGIVNAGRLTLNNTLIASNRARIGGGIWNSNTGELTINNSIISGNSVYEGGGGIYNSGNLSITYSTIEANTTSDNGEGGGGIYNRLNLTITNSTLAGNSTRGYGGGIYHFFGNVVSIRNSTLVENRASWGGGIATLGDGGTDILNSTLYGNSAAFGGGILSFSHLSLIHSTLSGNSAAEPGGGVALYEGDFHYANTIIANSTSGGDCYFEGDIIALNINNLVGDGTCSAAFSGDPRLGPLADNGGPTQTVALLPGSPAIDAADDGWCALLSYIDQRGVTRPQGAHCDIGAFELEQSSDTLPPAVTLVARVDPNPTAAASVNYLVTFSESVTGVDAADFALTSSGVTNEAITGVAGAGAQYTVTVVTGIDDGTIRLDVVDDDSILDAAGNPLGGVGAGNGSFSSGEVYDIQKNDAPTDIQLSAATIAENLPAGTTVGTLTTIDADASDTHTYSFCGGANDTSFALAGNVLNTATMFDYEVQSTLNICIRSTDAGGLFTDKAFQILVEVVLPPQANFVYNPVEPSIFDTIQFSDRTNFYQFDPAASFAWDFGDGTTSSDRDPTHRYASDGDYTVLHTIRTLSGGTSSISQTVTVRTHDVAITRVAAPSSANVGQTRPITVYIKNNRYAETVLLELYKSNPNVAGGFELVGSYTQFVPVRSGNRTSAFTFNYTFTAADLAIGKVTFKAVTTLVNGHDAIPSDNTLSSAPPTVVKR
jgi:hypothetical protein